MVFRLISGLKNKSTLNGRHRNNFPVIWVSLTYPILSCLNSCPYTTLKNYILLYLYTVIQNFMSTSTSDLAPNLSIFVCTSISQGLDKYEHNNNYPNLLVDVLIFFFASSQSARILPFLLALKSKLSFVSSSFYLYSLFQVPYLSYGVHLLATLYAMIQYFSTQEFLVRDIPHLSNQKSPICI